MLNMPVHIDLACLFKALLAIYSRVFSLEILSRAYIKIFYEF